MGALRPDFKLQVGSFQTSSDHAAAGPVRMVVERDMDVAADALEVWLMQRPEAAPGDVATLELGHDGETEAVFTGEIVELLPGLDGARVRALGAMNKLLNLRKAATYQDQSAGSIVQDLLDAAGLEAGEISDGPGLPRFAVDRLRPAWAHAKSLADRLGYELYAGRDGRIHFRAHGAAADLDSVGGLGALAGGALAAVGLGGGAAGYAYGRHLIELHASRRTTAVASVEVGGESPTSTQGDSTAHWLTPNDTDYRGAAGSGEPARLILDPAARTKDLADRFAAGHLAAANRRAHEITMRVLGRPELELGGMIQVTDVPDALANGEGYIRALRHRFGGAEGFATEVRIALDVQA